MYFQILYICAESCNLMTASMFWNGKRSLHSLSVYKSLGQNSSFGRHSERCSCTLVVRNIIFIYWRLLKLENVIRLQLLKPYQMPCVKDHRSYIKTGLYTNSLISVTNYGIFFLHSFLSFSRPLNNIPVKETGWFLIMSPKVQGHISGSIWDDWIAICRPTVCTAVMMIYTELW
jgi:hypothetical protein